MMRIVKQFATGLAGLMFAAAALAGNDALVSPGEAHGVVRLDTEKRAEHIYPVKVVEINGDRVSVDDKVALWLKPGTHTLTVRGSVDRDATFGIQRSVGRDQGLNTVEVTVEEGKVYYIGAQVNPREGSRWQPVVWKVEDARAS